MEDSEVAEWKEISVLDDGFEESASSKPNLSQIFAAVAVCYFCIIGGNLQGYTSSAIPSMKESRVGEELGDHSLDFHYNGSDNYTASRSSLLQLETKGNIIDNYMGAREEFQNLSHSQASWISGLSPLGAFFGSVAAPLPLNRFGPRGAIIFLGGPIFLLSWVMTAFAPSLNAVYLARFIGGTAIGISTSCAPVYIMETAPITLRGPLGTLPQCFFVVGILISFVIGSFLEWRETAIVCATLNIPGIFLLLMSPESPKWLLSKRRVKEAEKCYFRLNGYSLKSVSEFFVIKADYIASMSKNERIDVNQNQDKAYLKDKEGNNGLSHVAHPQEETSILGYVWNEPGVLKATGVVFGLMTFQQITGINGVNFYTVTIFNEALGSDDAVINGHLSSVIVAGTLVLATFSSIYLIERIGRKLLLVVSIFFMGLGAISIGGFFYVKEHYEYLVPSVVWLPLISLVIFVVAFSVGYGPVCWIIGAEILDPKIRSTLNPVAVGFNWLFVFAIAKSYPDLVHLLGTYGTFWLYGTLAFVGLAFTLICVPETKGKSEQQIQLWFRNKQNQRV